MKLKFFISRPANKFYYLQNLVPWHFSSRYKNAKEWEKITGPLKNKEKEIIEKFTDILKHKDYQYNQQGKSVFPGVPFFLSRTEAEAFEKAKAVLDKKQLFFFKQVFDVFESKFSRIWNNYKNKFSSLDEIISETKNKSFKKLMNRASVICGINEIPDINVSVIISPALTGNTAAGTAISGYDAITLELPIIINKDWVKIYSLGVLAHEIIHIILEKENFSRQINTIIAKNDFPKKIQKKPISVWINESIVESLAPIGFLMQNYYPNKIGDCLLLNADRAYSKTPADNLRYRLLWEIYPMATYYGRNKKPIDRLFIENTIKTFKEIIKKNKRLKTSYFRSGA